MKPDLRAIRLLPIFSTLYVLRRTANAELQSQHDFWQLGLYVSLFSNFTEYHWSSNSIST